MGKLKVMITMTLDGYIAGPNQSINHPLGEGAERLHDWLFGTRTFHEMHGGEGGETGINDDVVREDFANLGATIMGRNMFGGGPGPWPEDPPWNGWWGDNPPFHSPVFVLTHYARPHLEMHGGTTFYFVTEGIEAALRQATAAAARERDIAIGGGASVIQQYLAAGLVDEIQLNVAPMLLGAGERLFDNLKGAGLRLEPIRTIEAPGVTHLEYRILK